MPTDLTPLRPSTHRLRPRAPLRSRSARRAGVPVLLLLLALFGCGGGSSTVPTPPADDEPEDVPVAIPSRGTTSSLDVATWNVEWFGDPGNGPSDELLQLRRVRDVITGAQIDLWGLQEVVGSDHFSALLDALPGYEGLLANDPSVVLGPEFYSDFGGNEQKVALIWRTGVVDFLSAEVILTGNDYDFAGRPPLEVRATVEIDGVEQEVIAIVLHAKASTDEASWTRRRDAAIALKAHLDTDHPDARVVVLGDFNDDLDVSIRPGSPSPYENFLNDPGEWSFVTAALTAAGATSTIGYDDVIDHILVSDESAALYVDGTVEVFRLDSWIDRYGDTTSDHYPVLSRFRTGG